VDYSRTNETDMVVFEFRTRYPTEGQEKADENGACSPFVASSVCSRNFPRILDVVFFPLFSFDSLIFRKVIIVSGDGSSIGRYSQIGRQEFS